MSYTPIPPINVHARIENSFIVATDTASTHEGQFSDGVDWNVKFTTDPALYIGTIASATTPYTGHPAFPAQAEPAILSATSNANLLNFAKLFNDFSFGPFEVEIDTPKPTFRGFKLEQYRFLTKQYGFAKAEDTTETQFTYADPVALAAIRSRPTRLYCAMREVHRRTTSDSTTMSSRAAWTTKILGKDLSFFYFEPTVLVHIPETHLGTNARWFTLPTSMGVRVNVVKGILPSFPEVRYPMNLAVGETEVLTRSELAPISGAAKWDFRKTYVTGTQADGIASQSVGVTPSVKIPIGSIAGVVNLFFNAKMPFKIGEPDDLDDGKEADKTLVGVYDGTHYYGGTSSDWPKPRAPDLFDSNFSDGVWEFNFRRNVPEGELKEIQQGLPWQWEIGYGTVDGVFAHGGTLAPSHPMVMRGFQSDDRTIASTFEVGLSASIEAEVGLPKEGKPLRIGISAEGGVTASEALRHKLSVASAAFIGEDGNPSPGDMLTVTPSGQYKVTIDFGVDAFFEIELPFGTWGKKYNLLDMNIPTVEKELAPWPENERLRVGFSSAVGPDPRRQPVVPSRLPRSDNFPALPTDIDTCLADSAPLPPDPLPLPSVPASDTPGRSEMCAYWIEPSGTPLMTTAICADKQAYLDALQAFSPMTVDERACNKSALDYFCAPVSHEGVQSLGPWVGHRNVGHVLDIGSAAAIASLGNVMKQCALAYTAGVPDSSKKAEVDAYMDKTFDVRLCDATAAPLPPASVDTPGVDIKNPCAGATCKEAVYGACGWCTTDSKAYPGSAKGPDPKYGSCDTNSWIWTKARCP